MEFGLSTRPFAARRLTPRLLDAIYKAGVQQFEIFGARQHLDYYDSRQVADIAQWFKDSNLALHSIHAPLFAGFDNGRSGGLAISPSYTEKRLRIESMDEIKRALEMAERLPFRWLVLHLGLPGDEYDPRKLDAAFTSLEHLRIFAKERGVSLLLENTTDALGTPERLVQFIQYTRLELKVCFDAGHARLTGGVPAALELLGPWAAAAHLHDNKGDEDSHLAPFEGSIDWPAAISGLSVLPAGAAAMVELHAVDSDDLSLAREAIRKLREIH